LIQLNATRWVEWTALSGALKAQVILTWALHKCLTLDRVQTSLTQFSLNRHFQPAILF